MPYYRWRGIELTGKIKKGRLFASSLEHLDELLIKRQIALLSGNSVRQWVKKPIRLADKAQLFRQLATLIDAGVLVPDALAIVANQLDRPQLQEIVHNVVTMVHEGESLSDALGRYPQVCNQIMIQLIRAGEESGKLGQTLDMLCSHIAATQDFYRRLRSALLLPAITLIFFLGIVLIIFTVIMPNFIDIFSSMQQSVPPLTQKLLAISLFLRSYAMGLIISLFSLGIIILWRLTRRGTGRWMLDWFLVHLPIVGSMLQQRFVAYAMQALAVLLQGGMPLAQALSAICESIDNHIFRDQIAQLELDVVSGSALSDAMARHSEGIFTQDAIAMVQVAQESGRLPDLLYRVSQTYYGRVTQRLSWLTLILQPTVMIMLGLLVALLIFAVYGPIFNLSSAF